ncbi:hypothetical protein GNI_064490 [Gregarina niphandrodes]|uniref:Transmembrane protein n=1 Tax=Gregarina niphandrodes TaxID=110365 RepID=A0A023B842_GRENI|nr:hypothetical protein GNI_064490 [Gregarina niphandrodes]EZG68120.1 hypothetical protein GNI_064490 [Gregarina niphandrodes]|eukprot:XP_011130105.1 hypothetical protein GNI_064490 [Gregarina niphandrodes]
MHILIKYLWIFFYLCAGDDPLPKEVVVCSFTLLDPASRVTDKATSDKATSDQVTFD